MVTVMPLSISQMLWHYCAEKKSYILVLFCVFLICNWEGGTDEVLTVELATEYEAFPCSPWVYSAETVRVFAELADAMHDFNRALNTTVLTSRHVGHGFCMLVAKVNGTHFTMFNPRLLRHAKKYKRVSETSLLCNTTQAASRSTHITVEWTDLQNTSVSQEFANLAAYQLQHALDVLEGKFVCAQ